jgi:hypothetical protein
MPRQLGERKPKQQLAHLRAKMPKEDYAIVQARIDALRKEGSTITMQGLVNDLLKLWAEGKVS